MHNFKIPKPTNYKKFFKNQGLEWIIDLSEKKKKLKDIRIDKDPHLPDLEDLYFLYQLLWYLVY